MKTTRTTRTITKALPRRLVRPDLVRQDDAQAVLEAAAAAVIEELLETDKAEATALAEHAYINDDARKTVGLLSTKQRHALHIAAGKLRKG